MTVVRVTTPTTTTPLARRFVLPDRAWLTFDRLRLAADLFTLLVIVSVALAAAALVWRVTGYDDGRPEVAIAQGPSLSSRVDLTPILRLAPFGQTATVAAAGGAGTAAGLTLRGVVLAVPIEASTALISAGDGATSAYGFGQTLPGGAVIEGVERDRVILRTGAGQTILTFPEAPAAAATMAAPAIFQPVPPPAPAPPPAPPAPAPAAPAAAGAATLLPGLSVTPSASGWQVGESVPPAMRAAGVQPGDVIASVDGRPPDEAAADPAFMTQAVASGRVQAEVIRGGRRQTLSFPLR